MTDTARLKGQPLIVLMALLAGWGAGRAMNWDSPAASARTEGVPLKMGEAVPEGAFAVIRGLQSYQDGSYDAPSSEPAVYGTLGAPEAGPLGMIPIAYPVMERGRACDTCAAGPVRMTVYAQPGSETVTPRGYMAMPPFEEWGESAAVFAPSRTGAARRPLHPVVEAAPPMVRQAGYASVQPLLGLSPQATMFEVAPPGSVGADPASAAQPVVTLRRWSMDSWAFMRRDGNLQLASGLLPATYGANQIGGVLRFRLSLRSRLQPTLYVRTDSTTGAGRYATVAGGASLRPLARVPVVLALEGRMLDDSAGRHYQPAALAVTQMPRFPLPHGLTGEIYAQGGWVGGRYATPFADGQVRIDHGLLAVGKFETRAGLGAWGGVQKGASRLDAGPTVAISFPLTRRVFGRASLDWRIRTVGNAQPGSGPALTLSAGF